jgi:hypothetical protein
MVIFMNVAKTLKAKTCRDVNETSTNIYVQYRMHHLNATKQQAGPLPSSSMTLESRSPLLLGHCSRQLHKSCTGADMVYSRAECVFILEHYFTSQSFAAVYEAFSNAYADKEVPNKTTIQLVRKLLGHRKYLSVTSAHQATKQLKIQLY